MLGQIVTVLLKPSGPRRDKAAELDSKLITVKRENAAAIVKNMNAVKALINETIDMVEGKSD